jgi:hypothetical protein
MKRTVIIIFSLLICFEFLQAQTVYEFSFTHSAGNNALGYKAFFVDNNDGSGKLRLKFANPSGVDSVLVDYEVKEEYAENKPGCNTANILYYKLQKPKFIVSKDPGVSLPLFLCFKQDIASGLYEPAGIANSVPGCNTEIINFSKVTAIDQKDLTKEFVLTYFKVYEDFYRNQFVINNSKALTTTEKNTKLFLLFVCNDTDPKIGIADRKAMHEAISLFRKIKDFLGISAFIYDTVTGRNFNKETVVKKINTFLTPGPNDIVVFYYAGHGFRKQKDLWAGPYIDLRDVVLDWKKPYLDNSLSTEYILKQIQSKGARLNLIISESCNDTITRTNPMVKDPPMAGKKGGFGMNWSTQNGRDLFLNAMPQTILIAAASPGQLAISNDDFGGYFSSFFRNNLEISLGYSKTKVKWEQIVEATQKQTETKANRTWCNDEKTIKCNRQKPFIKIMSGRF